MKSNHPKLYNFLAEQSILGTLMVDKLGFDRIDGILTSEDFYVPEHRAIFDAICELAKLNQLVEIVTVTNYLTKAKDWTKEQETFVYNAAAAAYAPANLLAYAKIVKDHTINRRLLKTAHTISDKIYSGEESAEQIAEHAEKEIFAIGERGNKGEETHATITHILADVVQMLETRAEKTDDVTGIKTGFDNLNYLLDGLHNGDLIILAARPAMGKTAFALNIAQHVALNEDTGCIVFSLEMTRQQLGMRLLSTLTQIQQNKLRSANIAQAEWQAVIEKVASTANKNLIIDDSSWLTPTQLRSKARRIVREKGNIGLIVIDYLQLLHIQNYRKDPVHEIAEISKSLKSLARELNIPVIALSQLNRGLESRVEKRPVMADLRQSGAIEQDADVILFIYRDEIYNASAPKGFAEIIVAKHRHGATGRISLRFDGALSQFYEVKSH